MFAKGWNDNRKQGKEWAKEHIAHYWAETYHKPTDQTHPDTDDYSGLLQEVQLFFDLGYKLAQDTGYPDQSVAHAGEEPDLPLRKINCLK